jgi:hypothetical protein
MPFDHLPDCASQMWPRAHPARARRSPARRGPDRCRRDLGRAAHPPLRTGLPADGYRGACPRLVDRCPGMRDSSASNHTDPAAGSLLLREPRCLVTVGVPERDDPNHFVRRAPGAPGRGLRSICTRGRPARPGYGAGGAPVIRRRGVRESNPQCPGGGYRTWRLCSATLPRGLAPGCAGRGEGWQASAWVVRRGLPCCEAECTLPDL